MAGGYAKAQAKLDKVMESVDLLFSKVEDLQFTQHEMQVKLDVNSKAIDRWRRNHHIMVKQLGCIDQTMAKLATSSIARATGDGTHSLQQGSFIPDASQVFVRMSQEVNADQTLDGLLCLNAESDGKDREEGEVIPWLQDLQVACAASKLALGADSLVGEGSVFAEQKQVLIQASGVWGSAAPEGLDVPACVEITWDKEMPSDIPSHEGLLQQLAHGRNCFVDEELLQGVESNDSILTLLVHGECPIAMDDKPIAELVSFRAPIVTNDDEGELFNGKNCKDVIWDAEPHFDSHGLFQEHAVEIDDQVQCMQINFQKSVLSECDAHKVLNENPYSEYDAIKVFSENPWSDVVWDDDDGEIITPIV